MPLLHQQVYFKGILEFQFISLRLDPRLSMEIPMQPTFGVELEFIVRYRIEDYEPAFAMGEGDLCPTHLYMSRSAQFAAIIGKRIVATLRKAAYIVNDVFSRINYENWTVANDGTISWDDLEISRGFDYCGVEFKTPALPYSEEALILIQRAVMLIKSHFQVFVNQSCGLHVHVGNRDSGFPLQTLKNIGMLTTIFERQIDMIHPEHRLASLYAQRVASQFRQMGPLERAQRIDDIEDIEELIDCYHLRSSGVREGYMAYNFLNLVTGRGLKTVEFRQHEGSLDPEVIIRWAQLANSIVMIAHNVGAQGFAQLVQDHAFDSDYTIIDLLRDLGLNELANYYWGHGIHQHQHQKHALDWIAQLEEERHLEDATDQDPCMPGYGPQPGGFRLRLHS